MKLLSITCCNFRQFYGKTPEITLAGNQRNTTIIYGNNGSGKTTLMNGFTWVLYEKFSAAFAAEESLVNKRAMMEATPGKAVACWVEVVFEHDNKRYQAQRICRAYRHPTGTVDQGSSELHMKIAGDDGCWNLPPQPPEEIIGRILPESLHQYFFFDGERIDHIIRYHKKAEIAEATKELLGIEVLERSIRHLGEARKSLELDLQAIGNPETKKLLKDKAKLEQDAQLISQRQGEIVQELEHQTQLKKTLSSRLLEFKGAEGLPQQREQLEAQATSLKEQFIQAKDNLQRLLSLRAYPVFLSTAMGQFEQVFEALQERGDLATGIQKTFVERLLLKQECLCGTPLIPQNAAYQSVYHWIEKAAVPEIIETTIRVQTKVEEMPQHIADFWQEVDRQQEILSQGRAELSRVETQLDDIKKKLRNYPNEDIQQLQKRLEETEAKIRDLDRETGANKQQISQINKEIEGLGRQIDKQVLNEQKQVLIQRRIAATQEAMDRLGEVRGRLDTRFRWQLEQRVQEIFSRISFKPYVPKLNEQYELRLVENTGGKEESVAASTGENQILSLSFIGGIIDAVREWSQKNTFMGPDSSTFPIVMDSPFGSLDEVYRRQIALAIPKLANQLVVLVTKTQWRGEVAQEMQPYIGREYILVYNSPKPDCQEDEIVIDGVAYPLVRQSPNEFEYTEIIEVEYQF